MRHRLFLLSLVAVLLLVQILLRTAAMATPFSQETTWGGLSFWELRGALPLGVFAAAWLMLTTAALSQCAQSALLLAGRFPPLAARLGNLVSAGLWCGIPLLACCLNALPHIFPRIPTGWQAGFPLEWMIHGCIILLLLCRGLTLSRLAGASCFTLPAALLCLLLAGMLGFGHTLILLPAAAMTSAGLLMLRGRGRRWVFLPLLTGIVMNAVLFQLTASPVATLVAAWVVYTMALGIIATLLYLKEPGRKA